MSKKSRKRNKKILAALALAGGAALMARKGKGTSAVTGVVNPNAPKTEWIKKVKKDVLPESKPEIKPINDNIYRTRHMITDSGGNRINSTNKMANIAAMNAPKGIYPPGMIPMPRTGPGPRRFKHGGKVTGIAKRGFGRALMKGKK